MAFKNLVSGEFSLPCDICSRDNDLHLPLFFEGSVFEFPQGCMLNGVLITFRKPMDAKLSFSIHFTNTSSEENEDIEWFSMEEVETSKRKESDWMQDDNVFKYTLVKSITLPFASPLFFKSITNMLIDGARIRFQPYWIRQHQDHVAKIHPPLSIFDIDQNKCVVSAKPISETRNLKRVMLHLPCEIPETAFYGTVLPLYHIDEDGKGKDYLFPMGSTIVSVDIEEHCDDPELDYCLHFIEDNLLTDEKSLDQWISKLEMNHQKGRCDHFMSHQSIVLKKEVKMGIRILSASRRLLKHYIMILVEWM